ncbi:MAG: prepilin-type N-terminal cleavage/methylation domain-containing protein [Ruminococcaceae bacterium]|nr:prepilin-type N-terminal cleavage/methylation domain-containing protein [Oscillospiraceae bacterium]
MKKTKRGFTIVELVIVIAVIAILAAILIPVFANVTDNANEAAAKAEIKNAYSAFVAEQALGGYTYEAIENYLYVNDKDEVYTSDGKLAEDTVLVGTPTPVKTVNGYEIYLKSTTTTSVTAAPANP